MRQWKQIEGEIVLYWKCEIGLLWRQGLKVIVSKLRQNDPLSVFVYLVIGYSHCNVSRVEISVINQEERGHSEYLGRIISYVKLLLEGPRINCNLEDLSHG